MNGRTEPTGTTPLRRSTSAYGRWFGRFEALQMVAIVAGTAQGISQREGYDRTVLEAAASIAWTLMLVIAIGTALVAAIAGIVGFGERKRRGPRMIAQVIATSFALTTAAILFLFASYFVWLDLHDLA